MCEHQNHTKYRHTLYPIPWHDITWHEIAFELTTQTWHTSLWLWLWLKINYVLHSGQAIFELNTSLETENRGRVFRLNYMTSQSSDWIFLNEMTSVIRLNNILKWNYKCHQIEYPDVTWYTSLQTIYLDMTQNSSLQTKYTDTTWHTSSDLMTCHEKT